MNKLYGEKRQFGIHSRHMSQRQTPSSIDNLIKRQQSANRISRVKIQNNQQNVFSTALFPKRDSRTMLMSANNKWSRPKINLAYKDQYFSKQQTQVKELNNKKLWDVLKSQVKNFSQKNKTRQNAFQEMQEQEEIYFKKLCQSLGIFTKF